MSENTPFSKAINIIAVLVFLIGLSISYLYHRYQSSGLESVAIAEGDCDLRKAPCTSVLANGHKVSFAITPKTIPQLEPLNLTVETQGFKPSAVTVRFIGLNMDMGFNRSVLTAVADTPLSTQFKGEFVIPICINSRMEWEARVELMVDGERIVVPYWFYTVK